MSSDQVDCTRCEVGAWTIYAPTFARSKEAICSRRTGVVQFKAHQTIQRPGEVTDQTYTLWKGWACRAVHFHDGRRQILSFFLPGDTIGVEALCADDYQLPFTVRALTDVTLCGFSPRVLRDVVLADAAQRQCFAEALTSYGALVEGRLVDVGRRLAIARLARLMLELEERLRARDLASGDEFDLPLRQEDLADALGLTSAHVNRTLLTLRRDGVLDVRAGKVHVLNRKLLETIARDD